MKRIFTLILCLFAFWTANAQDHVIQSSGLTFVPNSLTITVGQTVEFQITAGNHNINGSQTTFPENPEGFFLLNDQNDQK